jgi:hypothetical protein
VDDGGLGTATLGVRGARGLGAALGRGGGAPGRAGAGGARAGVGGGAAAHGRRQPRAHGGSRAGAGAAARGGRLGGGLV